MNNINKNLLATIVIVTFSTLVTAQELTQTVRGVIIDIDSKKPIIGVEVVILGLIPKRSTQCNDNGVFRFDKVPLGRISLQIYDHNYEPQTIPNIEVNSAQEVVLNLSMQKTVIELDKMVVKASKTKGKATNDMSLLSSHSISVEQAKRYAGGYDDPSRVVTNYAGVTNTGSNSDIIVRGNSSKYMLWRLDGIEITSPYHFNDQNGSFGAFSALNNLLLRTSDFYTGAFSPEYGNALSSVFDVNLRKGNNEKIEITAGIGMIGTDLTIEGPLKKEYTGSFLVNYRFSTISLINKLGLIDLQGNLNFQDGNLKLVFPTKKIGTFSFFLLGGLDNFFLEDVTPDVFTTPGNQSMTVNESQDWDKEHFMVNTGLNHLLSINENCYIKTSLSYSTSGIKDEIFEKKTVKLFDSISGEFLRDSVHGRRKNFNNHLRKSIYRGAVTYNNRINEKNKIQIGTKYSLFGYNYKQSNLNNIGTLFTSIDFDKYVSTIQNFISWQFRLNKNLTIVSGFHNMNVLLNNKSTFEPRIAVKWNLNESNLVNVGYGMHSTMESIHHYFAKVEQDDGSIIEPNKDLDLLKAHHFVLGYEKRFTERLMAKFTAYYQDLYNLPVENRRTSHFATINEGTDYSYVDLVNKGTGKNYGIEITVERFFDNNYYFLINTSMFNSTYKSLEGIERNTRYNQKYLANILFGKEFCNLGRKKNRIIGLNCKMSFRDGQKYIPLLRDANGNVTVDTVNNIYWDYNKAYEKGLDNIYQINLSVSYKFNRRKTTHEFFLDLQNITNSKARINEFFDPTEPNSVGYEKQMGFFPNLLYRIYF